MAHAALSELRALDKHSLDDNDIRVDPSKSQVPAARSPTNSLYVGPGERPAAVSVNFARAYADNDKNGLSALSRRSHNRRRKRTRKRFISGSQTSIDNNSYEEGEEAEEEEESSAREQEMLSCELRLLRQILILSHLTEQIVLPQSPIVLLA